jgi:hypothetical protein
VWDVTGVLKPQTAKATNETLWQDLASEDAVAAYEAVCALAGRKDVAFLASRVRPVEATSADKISQLVADLDNREFAVRERARRALEEVEELAQPQLRKAMAESASLEVRRRVETLLSKLEASPPSAKTVQAIRAVEALERIATPEARQLLKKLANGAREARLTHEAKASLERRP